jgi:hypothetical protein
MSQTFKDLYLLKEEIHPITPKEKDWMLSHIPDLTDIGPLEEKEYADGKGYDETKKFHPIKNVTIIFLSDYVRNKIGTLEAPKTLIDTYIEVIKNQKIDINKPSFLLVYRRGKKAWWLYFFEEQSTADDIINIYNEKGYKGLHEKFKNVNDTGTICYKNNITGNVTGTLRENIKDITGDITGLLQHNIISHNITKHNITEPSNNIISTNLTQPKIISNSNKLTEHNTTSNKITLTKDNFKVFILDKPFYFDDWSDVETICIFLNEAGFVYEFHDFKKLMYLFEKEGFMVCKDSSRYFKQQEWKRMV